jgi:hypothetical protein
VGFKLRSMQQFDDKMYNFNDYLVIENNSEEHAVIIPQGEVKVTNNMVSIQKPSSHAMNEISSRAHNYNIIIGNFAIYKVKMSYVVFSLQPFKPQLVRVYGTCMTRFEMSIRHIRKCWINSPLKDDDQNMLRSLLVIKDLPPALVIIVHQLVSNSFQLAFLYKDPPRPDLDSNAFAKALNEYNLPLQPHIIYTRNYRLSLTLDEMNMAGAVRTQRHAYTMNSESNGFNDALGVYQRKKPDVVACEDDLFNLISQESKKNEIKFPLKKLPMFTNQAIGNLMVDKLVKSHEYYSSLPKLTLHDQNMRQVFQTPMNMDHSIEVPVEVMHKVKLYLIYQKLLKMQSSCR